MPRESMEKMFKKKLEEGKGVEGKEEQKGKTGEEQKGEPPKTMPNEKLVEIKAKEKEELDKVRKDIGEMMKGKGEEGKKKVEEKPEGLPEDFRKKYQEVLMELEKRGIVKKLRNNEELTPPEKLLMENFMRMKVTKDFLEKFKPVTEALGGIEGTLKEAAEKKKEK